jgi:hypothetical protein
MNNFSKKKLLIWLVAVAAVAGVGIFLAGYKNEFSISGPGREKKVSPLTGEECENADARPIAIMVSSDAEARPLSGIGEADMVFEMPVVENGFTRMMAVYQCGRPKEVGSVRSARLDFMPLALGLDVIYAHFGGEHEVLEKLNKGVIDNIDGLKYDEIYYYRKSGIPRPHNSFTNFDLLGEISSKLGYESDGEGTGYPHDPPSRKTTEGQVIEPPPIFNEDFRVEWKYSKDTNSYLRRRSGKTEMDKNTGEQVEAKNVVIMETTWSPINKDYIRVKTVGSGTATIYKNGTETGGTWNKKDDGAKLYFYGEDGKEIKFVPGSIWIEITTN